MDSKNILIVAKLSIIDVWNKKSQEKEEMYIARDNFRNVFDYCDSSRFCNGTTKFTGLSPAMLNYGITFPMYSVQKSIKWIDIHIPGL